MSVQCSPTYGVQLTDVFDLWLFVNLEKQSQPAELSWPHAIYRLQLSSANPTELPSFCHTISAFMHTTMPYLCKMVIVYHAYCETESMGMSFKNL